MMTKLSKLEHVKTNHPSSQRENKKLKQHFFLLGNLVYLEDMLDVLDRTPTS